MKNYHIRFLFALFSLCLLLAGCNGGKHYTMKEKKLSSDTVRKTYVDIIQSSDVEIFDKGGSMRNQTSAGARGKIKNNFNIPLFLEKNGWVLIKESNDEGGGKKIYCKDFAKFDLLLAADFPDSFGFSIRSESC